MSDGDGQTARDAAHRGTSDDVDRDGSADADSRGRRAESPTEIPASGWKDTGRRVVGEMQADHVPVVAAGVAFYAWIALIPALLAVAMVYGLVASRQQVTDFVANLTGGLSADAASLLEQVVTNATGASDRGLGLGLVIALAGVLWSASGGMDGLIKGINIAYDEEPRTFPRRRGLAILLSLGAIVAVVITLGLLTAWPSLVDALGLTGPARIVAGVVRWVALAAVLMSGLAVVYRFAPHREDPRFEWVTPGALVATVLWLLGSVGFAVYVNQFGNYNQTYGAVAGIIVLNLWLFLTAFVILLGAEINSELEAQTRRDTTTGEPEPLGQRGAVKADQVAESP